MDRWYALWYRLALRDVAENQRYVDGRWSWPWRTWRRRLERLRAELQAASRLASAARLGSWVAYDAGRQAGRDELIAEFRALRERHSPSQEPTNGQA